MTTMMKTIRGVRVPPMSGGLFYYYICLHFPSSMHYIALNQTKRLRKKIKYILIHNNTLQSFV